jgi:aminoglycoside N3'-acetyltransferase
MSRVCPSELRRELISLGIEKGDVLYVKADLLKIGIIKGNFKTAFLEALLDVVGDEGTIITASYTKTFFFPMFNKAAKLFSNESEPNTGSFSKVMLEHPRSVRSKHPTNSYVALGKVALDLTRSHDHTSSSYEPLRKVMEFGGKCIIVGCVDSSPGHTTTHLAQYDLGYAQEHNFKGLVGATYLENDVIKVFYRKDFGGHNAGAEKIYSKYLDLGIIKTSKVGNTTAVISSAKKAYEADFKIIKDNKKFLLCNDPTCFSCRATWRYNLKDVPIYVISTIFNKMYRLVKKLI